MRDPRLLERKLVLQREFFCKYAFSSNLNLHQVIGIPSLVGEACLLLGSSLQPSELSSCNTFTGRSFNTFNTGINGVSSITGANALDIASIGLDGGLLTQDADLVTAAFGRIHSEVVVQSGVKVDGIRADGSFGQHSGIIYNGNYGKD